MAVDTSEVTEQPQQTNIVRRGSQVGKVSDRDVLLSQLRKQSTETLIEDAGQGNVLVGTGGRAFDTPDGAGVRRIEHKTSVQVRLYKPDGRAVIVPGTNVPLLLDEGGFLQFCPKCHTDCGGAVWGCALDPEPPYRQCTVCGRKFHETAAMTSMLSDDPNRIVDEDDELPSMNSLAKRNEHMWVRHADVAAARGIPRPMGMV